MGKVQELPLKHICRALNWEYMGYSSSDFSNASQIYQLTVAWMGFM